MPPAVEEDAADDSPPRVALCGVLPDLCLDGHALAPQPEAVPEAEAGDAGVQRVHGGAVLLHGDQGRAAGARGQLDVVLRAAGGVFEGRRRDGAAGVDLHVQQDGGVSGHGVHDCGRAVAASVVPARVPPREHSVVLVHDPVGVPGVGRLLLAGREQLHPRADVRLLPAGVVRLLAVVEAVHHARADTAVLLLLRAKRVRRLRPDGRRLRLPGRAQQRPAVVHAHAHRAVHALPGLEQAPRLRHASTWRHTCQGAKEPVSAAPL